MHESPTYTHSPLETVTDNTELPKLPVIYDRHRYRFSAWGGPIELVNADGTDENAPETPINTIVRRLIEIQGEGIYTYCYFLRTVIGSYVYEFSLTEMSEDENIYSFQVKSEKYGYAITELNETEREDVFKLSAAFIESISNEQSDRINSIKCYGSYSDFTVTEISDCIDKIVEHPDNNLARERWFSVLANANDYPHQIFNKYKDMYGQDYPLKNASRNVGAARAKLFKSKLEKYLMTWDIQDDQALLADSKLSKFEKDLILRSFTLVPKQN